MIIFDNVSVKYREPLDFALKEINFTINPKEKIGVVGRTGAGKSTIINALIRILECSKGKIIIDAINIAEIPLYVLREKLTTIMQVFTIFLIIL